MDADEYYKVVPLTDAHLTGLGGWLVLVGASIPLSLFRIIKGLAGISLLFTPNVWMALAYETSNLYMPWFVPYAMYTILSYSLLFGLYLYLAYLFFNKKRKFPSRFCIAILILLVMTIINFLIERWLSMQFAVENDINMRSIWLTVVYAMIWISYMKKSRRVKLTFVNS